MIISLISDHKRRWITNVGKNSRFQPTQLGHSGYIAGWLLYGGRTCGSREGMIVVVAIDTEDCNRLLVILKDAETLE